MANFIPGTGSTSAELMVVGAFPGKDEEEVLEPFVGATGNLVNQFLREAGSHRTEVWLTNVSKFRPPQNNFKNLHIVANYEEQVQILWKEINQIRPRCILALGEEALKALTGKSGIKKWRGSVLLALDGRTKVVPTYHPGFLLHTEKDDEENAEAFRYSTKYIIQFDFGKAVRESKTNTLPYLPRTLRVCKSFHDLYDFDRRNRHTGKVSIDIETFKCWPVCIGLAYHKFEALSIPLYRELNGIKVSDIGLNDLAMVWELLAKILIDPSIKKIGQNFKFDHEKIEMVGFKTNGFYADTMLMASVLYPELEKGLAFLASIYTNEPYWKDEGKDFNPKKDKIDQLLLYNAKDAAVTIEIEEEQEKELVELGLSDFYFDFVHKLHDLYRHIEHLGWNVDNERRINLINQYEFRQRELSEKLKNMIGEEKFNFNSPQQIKRLFETLKLPPRKDTSVDTIISLLANTIRPKEKVKRDILEGVLEMRSITKTLGTYLKAETDFDGRLRTSYKISGTETGRTSTVKLKAPLRPIPVGFAFQTLTKYGDVGNEVRSYLIPDKGKVLIEIDQSQAEARAVALLGNSPETLILFDTIDIHKFTAAFVLGKIPEHVALAILCRRLVQMPEEVTIDEGERYLGKKCRHSGNYDVGKRELMRAIMKDARRFHIPISVSEWKVGQLLDAYHRLHPWIRDIYQFEVREKLQQDRILITPFGRRREFYERWGEQLWKEAYAYIPQSTIADQTKRAALKVRERVPQFDILGESHDAIVGQCDNNMGVIKDIAGVLKEEFERPIDFSKCSLPRNPIVIPAEIKYGDNYKDLEKLK